MRTARFIPLLILLLVLPVFAGSFSDVPGGHPAYDEVELMHSLGFMNGVGDGTFGCDEYTTRYEFVVLLDRVWTGLKENFDAQDVEVVSSSSGWPGFTDVPGSHWANQASRRMVHEGFLLNPEDTEFHGDTLVSTGFLDSALDKMWDRINGIYGAVGYNVNGSSSVHGSSLVTHCGLAVHMSGFWLDIIGLEDGYLAYLQEQVEEATVHFADSRLEGAIRSTLRKSSGEGIFDHELETLTRLDLRHKQISNLDGIEYCTNLTYLNLDGNKISNLTPLQNLTKLTELRLASNDFTDVDPLRLLRNVSVLSISYNDVSDIDVLESMISLHKLYMEDCEVSNIQPLVWNNGLGRGAYINMRGCPLSSVSNQRYLSQLRDRGVEVDW